MAQTNINIRMDENLKKQFENFCYEVGLNMSTAINIFAKAVVKQQCIPFEITTKTPNEDTESAIIEARTLMHDENAKRYTNVDEMMEEILSDV